MTPLLAQTAENVAYAYDDTAGGNHGKGRLTAITDSSGSTAFVHDHRGNVTAETRVIGTQSYTTSHAHDLADNVTGITYPSGRIVTYARDAMGRVVTVTTKADALATPVTGATGPGLTFQQFFGERRGTIRSTRAGAPQLATRGTRGIRCITTAARPP